MKRILGVLLCAAWGSAMPFAGQSLILSLPETGDQQTLRAWLLETKPAGIMLMASHCRSRQALIKLTTWLQKETKRAGLPPLLITIDWEGGIVSRPHEAGGFVSVPSPWSLACVGRTACFEAGMVIGAQLRSVGVNMTFAPSLDCFDPNNQILATRCFARDPETIAACGIAFARGVLSQGVLPVCKHFPGLGLGRGDTHVEDVAIATDEKTLRSNMLPFERAVQAGIPAIMATHAIVKRFGDDPVTLSPSAVSYLTSLNNQLLLITDDACMKAMHHGRTVEESVAQALQAGYHLVIYSGSLKAQKELVSSLEQRLSADGDVLMKRQPELVAWKKQWLGMSGPALVIDEKKIGQCLARQCVKLQGPWHDLRERSVVMISVYLPGIRSAEQWFATTTDSYLATTLRRRGVHVEEHVVQATDEHSVEQVVELCRQMQDDDRLLILQTFFYANGSWNGIQRTWLNACKPLQERTIVVSLGHPAEQAVLQKATVFTCGSFQRPLLDRVAFMLSMAEPLTGADVLASNPAQFLQGKKIGLLCHRCSVVWRGGKACFLPDVIRDWVDEQQDETSLCALFSPEHGLLGTQEAAASVNSTTTSAWGCPVYSLHGNYRKPTREMLSGLDVVVIDVQDVGLRCYTYLSSMVLMLEAAAENKVSVVVVDRPNPIGVLGAQGPLLDRIYESFVGKVYVPLVHGVTLGALAQMVGKQVGADVQVVGVPVHGDEYFMTRSFIAPSPNLMSLEHCDAYPLTVCIEGTNYSEGRGTQYPFLQLGALWVNAELLAQRLNSAKLAGIYCEPAHFTPRSLPGVADHPKHEGTLCHGVFVHVYDPSKVKVTAFSRHLLKTLWKMYPEQSVWVKWGKQYGIDLLAGTSEWREHIEES